MDMEELKKFLIQELGFCEDYLRRTCLNKSYEGFAKIISTKLEDLPTLLNEGGLVEECVSKRLKGEKIDTPDVWLRFLYDEAFYYEDYKLLGENDGKLALLAMLFRRLGMDEEAQMASDCIYGGD